MLTAGRTPPPGAAFLLSPPGQERPPWLPPCATRRGRSPSPAARLISPAQPLARGGGPWGRARPAHWLGRCADPPGRPPPLQRASGAKALPGGRGGPGAVPSLGTFKGQIHVICPASRGNTVSLQHVGHCIYSTRRFRLGQTWTLGPRPRARLALTSGLHETHSWPRHFGPFSFFFVTVSLTKASCLDVGLYRVVCCHKSIKIRQSKYTNVI